jgi:hypothetical protein
VEEMLLGLRKLWWRMRIMRRLRTLDWGMKALRKDSAGRVLYRVDDVSELSVIIRDGDEVS